MSKSDFVLVVLLVGFALFVVWYENVKSNQASGGDAPLFQIIQDLSNVVKGK